MIVSPLSCFTFGMSVLCLPEFIHDLLLMPLNSSRIRCIIQFRFVLFLSLMHFLTFLFNSFSWCLSPFIVSRHTSMSLLISSFPSLVFSFLFSCDLDRTSVLFAFSLDAAAPAFVSSPHARSHSWQCLPKLTNNSSIVSQSEHSHWKQSGRSAPYGRAREL